MLLDYRNRSMHCSLIIPYSNVSSGAKQLNILFLCWRLHLHLILLSQKTKFASYKTSLLPNDLLIVIKLHFDNTIAKNRARWPKTTNLFRYFNIKHGVRFSSNIE